MYHYCGRLHRQTLWIEDRYARRFGYCYGCHAHHYWLY